MAPAKKGPQEKVEAQTKLQALVLADSFTQVFVFCCAHADQIKKYLAESKWAKSSSMVVTTIVSTNCLSVGEALRLMDQRDVIKGDFVLVSADTVSNADLGPILEEHKQRRAADKNAIMTMVMKPIHHPKQRLRLGETELIVCLDPHTKRLLKFHEYDVQRSSSFKIDAAFFSERDCVQVRTDLMDCQIAICAPEVLMLFSDNFDYQNVRRDFVTGVLSEEELGNKLYVHELTTEYAAHIHNLRSYDAISRDLLQRWCFPFVPDTNVLFRGGPWGLTTYRYGRGHVYQEAQVSLARFLHLGHEVCLGSGTSVGDNSSITQSVIGRNCRIGKGVKIVGSYIQDNVIVQDGATLHYALVCEKAVIRAGAMLAPGSIISYGVVIGAKHVVPSHTRISLCQQQQTTASLSDDELEYTATREARSGRASASEASLDSDDDAHDALTSSMEKPTQAAVRAAIARATGRAVEPSLDVQFEEASVGPGGAGYVWKSTEGFDIQRYSIAPPRTDDMGAESELEGAEVGSVGVGSKLAKTLDSDEGSEDGSDVEVDPEEVFKREVSETFLRCVKLRFDQMPSVYIFPDTLDRFVPSDIQYFKLQVGRANIVLRADPRTNAVIELNGLKIAENRTFADCARYIFTTMLSMCLPASPGVKAEYRSLFPTEAPNVAAQEGKLALLRAFKEQLREWGPLLQRFLRSEDEQVEVLLTFEEFCSEDGVFENSGEQGSLFLNIYVQVLQQLYEADVITEEAFIAWADEKAEADEEERKYLVKATKFIEWLKTADDSDEDNEEDDEEDDS